MTDDDTRPVLTPTLERRVAALETERAEDYDAGRRGAAQSQQMPAVRPR